MTPILFAQGADSWSKFNWGACIGGSLLLDMLLGMVVFAAFLRLQRRKWELKRERIELEHQRADLRLQRQQWELEKQRTELEQQRAGLEKQTGRRLSADVVFDTRITEPRKTDLLEHLQ